jgi:uncharacterized RDD family membrane protein YckC
VSVESQAREAQLEAIRHLRGEPPDAARRAGSHYAGLVTRTIAIALDGAIVWSVAAAVAVTVGLGVSLLHIPTKVVAVIASVGVVVSVLWSIAYFVFFWSSTGQTPGSRVMGITILDSRGHAGLKPRRALLRLIGLCLAAIPLLAGLLMMLWDERGRCLQDRLARTVVVNSHE